MGLEVTILFFKIFILYWNIAINNEAITTLLIVYIPI